MGIKDTAGGDVAMVHSSAQASALLDPLRQRIIMHAQAPVSAANIAEQLGLPRQRVNYHVRALANAGLLRKAGTRRKRNLTEQRYVASARAFVVAPTVLGPLAADPRRITDPLSAGKLLALAGRLQSELGESAAQAADEDKRLSTLSIEADLEFESPTQRAAFARALSQAVTDVVGRFSNNPGSGGRPFRLVVGCYPPPKAETKS
ncbi:MAG: helix-turn-helix domain-containing protein [Myxococcota bacterium]